MGFCALELRRSTSFTKDRTRMPDDHAPASTSITRVSKRIGQAQGWSMLASANTTLCSNSIVNCILAIHALSMASRQ